MREQFEQLDAMPRPQTNPYVDGRREFAERYADLVSAAQNWRNVALLALAIAAIAVSGVIYIGSQSKIVPHVVHVDRLGGALSVGRAVEANSYEPTIMRAQLARWVYAARVVYVDAGAQRASIDEAYALVSRGSLAHQLLSEHYRGASPFDRAASEVVAPRVHTVLRLSDRAWRVEWTETIRGRNGEIIREEDWQAAVTIDVRALSEDASEESVLRNPLGIFVTEFSWTKRLTEAQ